MFNILKKLMPSADINRSSSSNSSSPNSRNAPLSVLNDGPETATRSQLVQIMMRDLIRKSGIPPDWIQCHIQVANSRTRRQGVYVRLVVKHWDERLMKHAFAFQKALLTEIVQFEPKAATWLHGIAWQLEVADSCPVTELPASDYWLKQEPKQDQQQGQHDSDPFEIIPLPAHAMPATASAPVSVDIAVPPPVLPPAVAVPVLPLVASAAAPDLPNELEPLPFLTIQPLVSENDTEQDLERLFAIRDKELEHLASNNLLPVGYEKTWPAPLQP